MIPMSMASAKSTSSDQTLLLNETGTFAHELNLILGMVEIQKDHYQVEVLWNAPLYITIEIGSQVVVDGQRS